MSSFLNLPLCLEARMQNVHSLQQREPQVASYSRESLSIMTQVQIRKLKKTFSFQGPLETEKKKKEREGQGNRISCKES